MPSILSKEDKTVVKRAVPSPSNNIITVAVARLYVNYPNKHRWNFTGISGAVVLAEDLVGHTFFFKIVDVISNKGVMWDQELYEGFKYNHDRTFFHTFELEDCMAGFSFADEKEAGRFRDKVETREKYAKSKGRPAGFSVHIPHPHIPHMGRSDSISRNSPSPPAPKAQNGGDVPFSIDNPDPEFQALLKELMDMGITADQIKDNEDFIKSYIAEKEKNAEAEKRKRLSNGNGNGVHVMEVPGSPRGFDRSGKAPPPPPPAPPKSAPPPPSVPPPPPVLRNGIGQLSPQTTGSSTKSRRGLPPPPPIPRGSRRLASQSTGSSPPPPSSRSPAPPPPRATSPPTQPRFVVPPPLPTAGAYANSAPPPRPPLPPTERAPPLPPKTPLEENTGTKFAVPPPFQPPSRPPQAPPQLPPQAPPQLPPQAPPQLPPQAPPQLPPQPPPQAPQNRGLPVPVLPSRPAFPAPPPPPRPPVEAPPPTIRDVPPARPPPPPFQPPPVVADPPPAPPPPPPPPQVSALPMNGFPSGRPPAPPPPPPSMPGFSNNAPPPPVIPGFSSGAPPPPPPPPPPHPSGVMPDMGRLMPPTPPPPPPGFSNYAPPAPPPPPPGMAPGGPPPPPPSGFSNNAPPAPPPPPPPPGMAPGGPPPPPPLPGRDEGAAPLPSKSTLPPGDLLASIRGAGGIGALKKTKTVKDASAPAVKPSATSAPASNPMLALQKELDKRKTKVSNQSDDEDDGEW